MLNTRKNCPVCQCYSGKKPYAVYDNTHVLFCAKCGTGWVVEGREKEELSCEIDEGSKNYESFVSEQNKRRMERYFDIIINSVSKNIRSLSICDIGCGYGYFLSIAQKAGARSLLGLELMRKYVPIAKKLYDVEVTTEKATKIRERRKFDVVTMFDVIEHVSDLKEFILDVKSLLAPKGIIVVTTPRNNNLIGSISKLLCRSFPGIAGTFLNAQGYSREHIQLFSNKSLSIFLGSNNFKTLKHFNLVDIAAPFSFYDFPFAEKGTFTHVLAVAFFNFMYKIHLFPKNKQFVVAQINENN